MKIVTENFYVKALEYSVKGYSVFPIKPMLKIPLLSSWKQYQVTPASDEQIETWWTKNAKANIAIITGKVSGITVVDIDTKGGTVVPLDTFPKTYTVKTPSDGYHLYYIYEQKIQQTANTFPQFPHVDIRNDGGYVVAPPSQNEKGAYEVFRDIPIVAFPVALFGQTKTTKTKTTLKSKIGLIVGEGRDNAMTSIMGKLARSYRPTDWQKEVWEAACAINNTYKPPLTEKEMQRIYNSVTKTEQKRLDGSIPSPIEMTDEQKSYMSKSMRNKKYMLTVNDDGVPNPHPANIVRMLSHDPEFKDKIRYDVFRRQVQVQKNNKWIPFTDETTIDAMIFLQDMYNARIKRGDVGDAFTHIAYQNMYDEPTEWLRSLEWDGTPRVEEWLIKTLGVSDDSEKYHRSVGARWFVGLVARLLFPGCTFDNALVLSGPQGIGKTSVFRIIGGDWYREFTGSVGDKDFFLLLAGAAIVDLDEGAALSRADAMRIKAAISRKEDTYRSPYDKTPKTYQRRNVFAMTTNDHDILRDQTGNRRFWMVKFDAPADFKWLEDNRTQLFAEACRIIKDKIMMPEIPLLEAQERQAEATAIDPWEDDINLWLSTKINYQYHPEELRFTTRTIFIDALGGVASSQMKDLDAKRIGRILNNMGFLRRKIREGNKVIWTFVASDKLIAQVKANITGEIPPIATEMTSDEKFDTLTGQKEIPF